MQQDEIIIDGEWLSQSLRRQLRLWVWLGPLLGAALLLLLLAIVPRSYTASTSVAVQQSAPGGALAALTGVGGPSKRYLGLLKSRELATQVEKHVKLRALYGLPAESDAVTLLTKSVKPDDNAADGLLYIGVTLAGPPGLNLRRNGPSAAQVKAAAAQAANAYAAALRHYYATSDTDQGAVLLRGADSQVKQARAGYEDALTRTQGFTRGLNKVDPRSVPSPGDTTAASAGTGSLSGLATLYSSLAAVQAELRAAQAARTTRDALTTEQLQDLNNIPTDDPLLGDARSRVTSDQAALTVAERMFGPENSAVVRAQKQLQVDQDQLQKQVQGVRQRLTTPSIRSDEQIQALFARQSVLTKQINQAQSRLGLSRQLSAQFGRLQTEVALRLEVLKTTLGEAAKIRLNNASAGSTMSVVDPAEPPKGGDPGPLKLGAAILGLLVMLFALSLIRDYLRRRPAPVPNKENPL